MKTLFRLLVIAALAFCLPLETLALNKQAVVTSSVSTIFNPVVSHAVVVVIQNPSTSSGSISISLDGTDPTATLGIILAPGKQIIVSYPGGQTAAKVIKAILVSGAATVNVSTDDTTSQ